MSITNEDSIIIYTDGACSNNGNYKAVAGIGVYFYVGKLTIVQQSFTVSSKSYITAQLRMICIFARVLGIVFSLTGVASIISALDRLSLAKTMHKMSSFIEGKGEKG